MLANMAAQDLLCLRRLLPLHPSPYPACSPPVPPDSSHQTCKNTAFSSNWHFILSGLFPSSRSHLTPISTSGITKHNWRRVHSPQAWPTTGSFHSNMTWPWQVLSNPGICPSCTCWLLSPVWWVQTFSSCLKTSALAQHSPLFAPSSQRPSRVSFASPLAFTPFLKPIPLWYFSPKPALGTSSLPEVWKHSLFVYLIWLFRSIGQVFLIYFFPTLSLLFHILIAKQQADLPFLCT